MLTLPHRMREKDPEQPMESNGTDLQSRKLKMIRVMTVGLVIVFVTIIGIGVATGFLIHQKNEYLDLIHQRNLSITELNQQLVQLKEDSDRKEEALENQLTQMKMDIKEERELKRQFVMENERLNSRHFDLDYDLNQRTLRENQMKRNLNQITADKWLEEGKSMRCEEENKKLRGSVKDLKAMLGSIDGTMIKLLARAFEPSNKGTQGDHDVNV